MVMADGGHPDLQDVCYTNHSNFTCNGLLVMAILNSKMVDHYVRCKTTQYCLCMNVCHIVSFEI